ncbi:MAG: hypothetical protein SPI25_05370 [Dialister sp.]|nr:hypothetical protein [Dialister sp.]
MTLAELYEALEKLENGAEMVSTIKAEISKRKGFGVDCGMLFIASREDAGMVKLEQ